MSQRSATIQRKSTASYPFLSRLATSARRRQPPRMSLEQLEARQLLATGPELLSIKPDAATILQNFDVLETSPSELRFIFSQGEEIDPSTLDGIQVSRSGKDDSFERASAISDLGTAGGVVFRFDAAQDGTGGNGITLTFRQIDQGGPATPQVTVEGRTIRIELNSNLQNATTAGQLLTALTGNLLVNELLSSTIVAGSPLTSLVTGSEPPADVQLEGANRARAVTDLQSGGSVQVEFLAQADGPAGSGITVTILNADRGPGSAPAVTVDGKSITVTLNSNPNSRSTAGDLVAALQGNAQANSLVQTFLRAGATAADIADASATIPLVGGTDIQVLPAFAGLDPDRSNEVIVRFAEKLPDDLYAVDVFGAGDHVLRNSAGDAFDCETNSRLLFQIDRGAQVIAVVPQPIVRDAMGRLEQTKNVIDVYFNDDDLNPASATNPQFYRLIMTADTVTNTDDAVFLPTSIDYDPVADRARLTFGNDPNVLPGGNGTYRLRIGTAEDLPLPPSISQPAPRQVVVIPTDGGASSVDVVLTAVQDFGRAVQVSLSASDFGGPGLPRVSVVGDHVSIEANSNAANESTVQDLITAVEQSPLGSEKLVVSAGAASLNQAIGVGINALPPAERSFALAGVGSSYETATDLGTLTQAGVLLEQAIDKQSFPLDLPGSSDEPGHRDLEFERHLAVLGLTADQFEGISTISYNFRDVYGRDPNGVELHNVITETQKQRTREIFQLLSFYLGVQFYEVEEGQIPNVLADGEATITLATGDLRAIAPLAPTGPNDGIILVAGRVFDDTTNLTVPTVILDRAETWEDEYGGNWFETALRGITSVLGINDANDLPDITNINRISTSDETVFLGDHDIVHGQHLFRPESKDIDLYRFEVQTDGLLTAATIAERMDVASPLNSMLMLYREKADGTRSLVARNDDYFSKDSFLEIALTQGIYFVGVSASGNDQYDPNLEDSGFGGTTQGAYELRMNFRPDVSTGIVDATGKQLDGDADGIAGGVLDFWFQARDHADTIFVDKVAPAGGSGTLAAPYRTISAALQTAGPGDIVRIVGNGGADSELATLDDNVPYEVGYTFGVPLSDGTSIRVPRGVTVMIDEGAIFKMQLSTIVVGSTSPSVDRSRSALQVLGTPTHSVFFTSFNDETVGIDTSPFSTVPRRGDWGGLEFRNDADRNEGRLDYEAQGAFLNYVNHAEIRYGGGSVLIDSEERVISSIQLIDARPAISHNLIRFGADAAVASNPDSFEETTFYATDSLGVDYQSTLFTPDYRRVGPDIHDNQLVDNTINGMFIKVRGSIAGVLETMTVSGRWNDTDIVHVVSENLIVAGQSGGGILREGATTVEARRDARLSIDPGTVVKLEGTRIEVNSGAQLIAEGTVDAPVVFTALDNGRFGAGGTFATISSSGDVSEPGSWAGIYVGPTSSLSIDYAWISYAGGVSGIEGGFSGFNPVEIHEATGRIARSRFEFNADGVGGTIPSNQSNRNGRGSNADGTIFVRGAQPVIVNNVFANSFVVSSDGGGSMAPAVNINVNALNHYYVRDWGRATGEVQRFTGRPNNQGPLVRGNRFDNENDGNGMLQGMFVREQELTTESVFDDTDITHIVMGDIISPDFHTFGGLRLQSAPNESLVVKLGQPSAGITLQQFDFPTANPTDSIVVADFDNDGSQDMAVSTTFDSAEVLLNDGTGDFAPAVAYDVGELASSIDAADMDGDGDIDLVVTTFSQVALLSNNGDGTFAAFTPITLPRSLPEDVEIADLDGDGNPDLAISYFADANVSVLLNNGGGAFAAAVDYAGGGNGGNEIEAVDLDVDGDQDLVVANVFPDRSVSVLLNDGTGVFGAATTLNIGTVAESVIARDFDGDGSPDVAVGGENVVVFLKGNGDGTFAPQQNNSIISTASDIDAGDLNGDGNPDLATSNFLGGSATILLGNGDGTFQAPTNAFTGGGFALDLADLNGDGDEDIATATFTTRVTVLINQRSATANGGFIATGQNLENADRIGGRIQVVGQPGAPVILTSLADDSVGSGLTVLGASITDTNTDGSASSPTPGEWRGFLLDRFAHDRNVEIFRETELASAVAPGVNANPLTAQPLGELAASEKAGDENRRLGFELHGYLTPADRDVYSFRGAAGTEVWFDIDRTDSWLDTVIELVDADGNVLASSDSTYDESTGAATPGGIGQPLRSSSYSPADLWSSNPKDAGMRLVLPGVAGRVNIYHVRVRMNDAGSPISGGDSRRGGNYQLNIRLQDLDEVAGSTIRYADIRYATNGVELVGQPAHSPLLGELAETIADNNTRANAQNIGNVLQTERGAVSLAGSLSNKRDVDWFQFNVDYSAVDPDPHYVSSLVFDIDYADQLGRADTSIYLFDADGNLIFFNHDSNVTNDLVAPETNAGTDDLSRGSLGRNDAFLGPISLRNGMYFMAITSSANIPDLLYDPAILDNPNLLNDPGTRGTGSLTVRLEPIDTVERIAEERFPTTTTTAIPPVVAVLIDPATSVTPWHLGDLTLYVSSGTGGNSQISIVDPFTGAELNPDEALDPPFGPTAASIRDIAMRHDGTLHSFTSDDISNDTDSGHYLSIDWVDATMFADLGDDGITTHQQPIDEMGMCMPDEIEESDVGFHPQGMTFALLNGAHEGFVVGNRGPSVPPQTDPPCGVTHDRNIIYRFDPDTGVATSALGQDRPLNDPMTFFMGDNPGTQILERGFIDTTATVTGLAVLPSGTMYAVADNGDLFRINNPLAENQGTGMATRVRTVAGRPSFSGLVAGPRFVEGGLYENLLFGIDSNGVLHAFNDRGISQSVFYNGTSQIDTGVSDAHGIAFSNLPANLWHQTERLSTDVGHGIDQPPDFTREAEDGSNSINFNFESRLVNGFPDDMLLDPGNVNDFMFPGGAHGTVMSMPFDLVGYAPEDLPVVVFNYFLETEDAVYDPAANDMDMYDSLRVMIADGGGQWELLATNNQFQSDDEFDEYDYNPNTVELIDNTGEWRTARIDLSRFAGREDLRLRFDFASAGTLQIGNVPGDPSGLFAPPPILRTGGDELIVPAGVEMSDGDTFVVFRNGDINQSVGFEIDKGSSLVLPEGSQIADGDVLTLRVGSSTVAYEFDFDGTTNPQTVPVLISRQSSAEDVAEALYLAIFNSSFNGTPHLEGHRINIQAAPSLDIKTINAPSVTVDGASGVTGTNQSVTIHAGMSADEAAQAVRDALAAAFTNNVVDVIKFHQNIVRVVGHAVDGDRLGPMGLSRDASGSHGLPGDEFGNLNNIRHSRENLFQAVFVDDIVIGFAARGEMVSGAVGGDTFVDAPGSNDPLYTDISTGAYQVEIRPTTEFADASISAVDSIDPPDFLFRQINIRDRLGESFSLDVPHGNQIVDGTTFTLGDLTFEFENEDLGNGVQPGNITVGYDVDRSAVQIAGSLVDIINQQHALGALNVTAAVRPGATRIDLHGNLGIITLDESLYDESNDSIPTAVDAGIALGSSGTFRARGVIGDNYALVPLYQPDDFAFTAHERDVDLIRFELLRGQTITIDIDAWEDQTFLDSRLRLFDADGNQLATSNNFPAPGELFHQTARDPWLSFVVPEDGAYYVGVSAWQNDSYDPFVAGSGTDGGSSGEYEIIATVGGFTVEPVSFRGFGDENRVRDQGQILIHSNYIQDSADFGISLMAGERDPGTNAPHWGPPRALAELNTSRLARGPVLFNNVIVAGGAGAIRFSGDAGGEPASAVPFGRIVNNTLYGLGGDFGALGAMDTGVLVENNASPTILNNIVANFTTPISIDPTSSTTVLGGNLYRANTQDPYLNPLLLGSFDIDLDSPLQTNQTLFIDATGRNFYLAPGSRAIDNSIDALQDRPEMIQVEDPLGFLPSPILAPDRDQTGQLRVDDPDVEPISGIGQMAFKDRGALDRSDFTGPQAELVTPEDNDAMGIDLDPAATAVRLGSGPLAEIAIGLFDVAALGGALQGSGINDSSVNSADVTIARDGNTLSLGVDYRFDYDATGNAIVLTPLAGVWLPGSYVVTLNNQGITDIAGNQLQANQPDGGTRFTIALGQGIDFGDAPDLPYPTLLANDGARHTIEPGFFLGSSISGESNGQPSLSAAGDLGDDGISARGLLRQGTVVTFDAESSGAGFLDAWIDFNGDGDWNDAGEQILTSQAVVAGTSSFDVENPAAATLGETYGRFRLSRTGNLGITGMAPDGEVEDYRLLISDPGVDFGDAPDPSYPTLLSSDGAAHMIVPGFLLGTAISAEDNGQPSPAATADNDDGVVFNSTMLTGDETSTVTVTAAAAGMLDAWIDFNRDGDWDDVGEQIFASEPLIVGGNTLDIFTPADVVAGTSFARFRFSSAGGLTPTGLTTDGEVEDYSVSLAPAIDPDTFDYGDAPAPYPTLLVDDGARHIVVSGFYLGNGVDPEIDGQPTPAADGDTDDGVTFSDLLAGRTTTLTVVASQAGFLDAWIDFNGDGDWDDSAEQISVSRSLTSGDNTIAVNVPGDAINGNTIARFRFSSVGGLNPTGQALDGEVEDYLVTLIQPLLTWHNFEDPVDVNGLDGVSPLDALLVINELDVPMFSDSLTGRLFPLPLDPPPLPPVPPPPFFDVTNDGFVSPLDALLVINALPSNNPPSAPLSSGVVVVGDGPGSEIASPQIVSAGVQNTVDRENKNSARGESVQSAASGTVRSAVQVRDLALRTLDVDDASTRYQSLTDASVRHDREDNDEALDELFAVWVP